MKKVYIVLLLFLLLWNINCQEAENPSKDGKDSQNPNITPEDMTKAIDSNQNQAEAELNNNTDEKITNTSIEQGGSDLQETSMGNNEQIGNKESAHSNEDPSPIEIPVSNLTESHTDITKEEKDEMIINEEKETNKANQDSEQIDNNNTQQEVNSNSVDIETNKDYLEENLTEVKNEEIPKENIPDNINVELNTLNNVENTKEPLDLTSQEGIPNAGNSEPDDKIYPESTKENKTFENEEINIKDDKILTQSDHNQSTGEENKEDIKTDEKIDENSIGTQEVQKTEIENKAYEDNKESQSIEPKVDEREQVQNATSDLKDNNQVVQEETKKGKAKDKQLEDDKQDVTTNGESKGKDKDRQDRSKNEQDKKERKKKERRHQSKQKEPTKAETEKEKTKDPEENQKENGSQIDDLETIKENKLDVQLKEGDINKNYDQQQESKTNDERLENTSNIKPDQLKEKNNFNKSEDSNKQSEIGYIGKLKQLLSKYEKLDLFWNSVLFYVRTVHYYMLNYLPYPYDILLFVLMGYYMMKVLAIFKGRKRENLFKRIDTSDANLQAIDKKYKEISKALVTILENKKSKPSKPSLDLLTNDEKDLLTSKLNKTLNKVKTVESELSKDITSHSNILDTICDTQIKILTSMGN